jgi:sulfatase maturation enzyme AslB (radical SAM superfamily)
MPRKLEVINLYTAAVCNLNCVYCYIDKSPALQKIDNALENSFASDYYFDYSKELFEPEDLKGIHFWGGEPSMGLHRMYNLLPKFIEYYPNLEEFMMSTNFTIPNWFDEFYGFLKILGQYPYRNFNFGL